MDPHQRVISSNASRDVRTERDVDSNTYVSYVGARAMGRALVDSRGYGIVDPASQTVDDLTTVYARIVKDPLIHDRGESVHNK